MDSTYTPSPGRPLPRLRRAFLLAASLFSIVTLIMSAVVLQYSLQYTGTYLKSNPEVLFASGLTLVFSFVALTVGRNTFFDMVWCEIVWVGVCWFLYLGGDSTLNSQTPGLIFHPCGEYFLCRGLLVMFVFGLLSFFTLSFHLALLLITALHQHLTRAGHGRSVWTSRVDAWEGWRGGWTWEGRREERRRTQLDQAIRENWAKQERKKPPTHVLEDPDAPETEEEQQAKQEATRSPPPNYASPKSYQGPPPGVDGKDANPFARAEGASAV